MNMAKYRNIKVNGYDSKLERAYAQKLKMMQHAGYISELREQVPFLLQEAGTTLGYDRKIKKYRKIEYIGDFVYKEGSKMIVDDVKGVKTEVFRLKHKLFLAKYPDYIFKITTKEDF